MPDFPAGMPTSGKVDADPANLLRDVFLANQGRIRADLVDNMIGRHSFTYGQAIHDAWQRLQDEGYVVLNGDHWEWPIQMHAYGSSEEREN